jgi:hypothetical protein
MYLQETRQFAGPSLSDEVGKMICKIAGFRRGLGLSGCLPAFRDILMVPSSRVKDSLKLNGTGGLS